MLTRIHVNQHNIRHNSRCEAEDHKPVITIKNYKENIYSNKVDIVDDYGKVIATIVYSPDKPLSCGAKLWIECDSENVRIEDGGSYV